MNLATDSFKEYQLFGKSALVTGVSRSAGIGACVARALASVGANVFTTYYRPYDCTMPWGSASHEANEIIQELKAKNVKAEGIEADLSSVDTPKMLFAQAEKAIGPIDILINNATCDYQSDIYAVSAELLDNHYAVNVRGPTLLCAEFSRRHNGRPGGRIINLTSGQSLAPMPDNLPYSITKGAIEALTKSLSLSIASKGITVNAVDPGPTNTGWMKPNSLETLKASAPFGRVGEPEDAMRLILFIASAQAEWITGQVFHSRGGM